MHDAGSNGQIKPSLLDAEPALWADKWDLECYGAIDTAWVFNAGLARGEG